MMSSADPFFSSRSSMRSSIDVIATYATRMNERGKLFLLLKVHAATRTTGRRASASVSCARWVRELAGLRLKADSTGGIRRRPAEAGPYDGTTAAGAAVVARASAVLL